MYPNNKKADILCGFHRDDITIDGIFISNIKQYLFDIEKANEKLGRMKEGLTIKKVVTDFLSVFVEMSLDRLLVHTKFRQSKYFKQDFSAENIRFCLVCPKPIQKFMSQCFIDAGVIEECEITEQLTFISEVEAVAYHQISLNRKVSKLVPDNTYLLCDIDELSVGIAKIDVDTTESFCTVELIEENFKNGTTDLEVRFRNYLEENSAPLCFNASIINNLVDNFVKNIKVRIFLCIKSNNSNAKQKS